jgi:hypothetical protein
MLLYKLLILSVLLGVTEEVAGVPDGLGLVVGALPIVLLVGEHLLRHLVHLFLLCNRLQLGLLFFHELKDVALNLHLLELLRVLKLQVGLHEGQTDEGIVLLQLNDDMLVLEGGIVNVAVVIKFNTKLLELLKEGLG